MSCIFVLTFFVMCKFLICIDYKNFRQINNWKKKLIQTKNVIVSNCEFVYIYSIYSVHKIRGMFGCIKGRCIAREFYIYAIPTRHGLVNFVVGLFLIRYTVARCTQTQVFSYTIPDGHNDLSLSIVHRIERINKYRLTWIVSYNI